ncbi:SET domain [Popillia japonica]|uniref:SET domain n=1 Tax=Popillia japonica TaxID=7064 RepID=A0AAW1N2D2_POPJA
METFKTTTMFTIESNEIYGRYMVAAKYIKEGELILKETPAILGSTIEGFHLCFRCCKPLRTSVQVCKNCGIATLCSQDCQGINHPDSECTALKATGIKAVQLINSPQVIMPLRSLLMRNYNEDLWNQFLSMEAHLNTRKDTLIWNSHREYIEQPLRDLNLLTDQDLEQNVIQKICGVLDVNSFEVRAPDEQVSSSINLTSHPQECLRAVYVQASLMTHDCTGNTLLSVDDDFVMTVHASKPIPAGEIVFFNYGNCLKGTYERRQRLREGKYFDCVCRRCSDPSEMGTHLSSVKCKKCRNGLVIPTIPLSDVYKTSWTCQSCVTVYKGVLIKTTLDQLKEKIISRDPTSLSQGEQLLKNLETFLAPQHHLIIELKQNLIPLYDYNSFNEMAMKRKMEFCEDIIRVLKIVEPGISRLQGLALFQLQSTQINLANKQYQYKEIPASTYLETLLLAERNLTEAIKYLVYEPKNSPEGRLTKHALNDLKILKSTIKQMRCLCGEGKLTQDKDLLHKLTRKPTVPTTVL